MSKISAFAPAAILTLALALGGRPAAAHPQDGALNDTYGRLSAARTANDVAGMVSGFHPQALLVDSRPAPAVAGADLAAVLTPQRDRLVKDGVGIDSGYRIERRQVIGDDVAVDAGYMRQAMRREGAPEQVRYSRFLVTLKRDAGVWKIVGDASMPATAEAWSGLKPQDGLRFDP